MKTFPIYGTASPTARIDRSKNKGVETGMVPLIIIPSDLLAKFLLPVLVPLHFAGLSLGSRGKKMLVLGGMTLILLN